MTTDIKIKVVEKVASVIGAPCIVCGNSDYLVTFNFDKEWDTITVKTARFLYRRGETYQFQDVAFSGNTVAVPVLTNVEEMYLGVYAGELHTTTPARIPCKKSILCATSEPHDEPGEDVYQQLLDTINNLELLPTVSSADYGKALMVREDGHWVVMMPDFVHNQKDGSPFKIFFGTLAEWEAWEGEKTGVLFIPTDDNTLEEVAEAVLSEVLEKLASGEADTKTVNGLEIKRDENGVLKIGDVIIPQKRLIWSGSSDADVIANSAAELGINAGDKIELVVGNDIYVGKASAGGRGSCWINFSPKVRYFAQGFEGDDTTYTTIRVFAPIIGPGDDLVSVKFQSIRQLVAKFEDEKNTSIELKTSPITTSVEPAALYKIIE